MSTPTSPEPPPTQREPLIADRRLTRRAMRIIAFAPPLLLAAVLVGGGLGWAGGTLLQARHEPSPTSDKAADALPSQEQDGDEPTTAAAVTDDHDPAPRSENRGGNDRPAEEATEEPTEEATGEPTEATTEGVDASDEKTAEREATEDPDAETATSASTADEAESAGAETEDGNESAEDTGDSEPAGDDTQAGADSDDSGADPATDS